MSKNLRSLSALSLWLLATPAGAQYAGSGSFASYSSHRGDYSIRFTSFSEHGGGSSHGHGYGPGFGYGVGIPFGYVYYPTPLIIAMPVPVQPFPFAQGPGGLMLPLPPQNLVNPNPNPIQPRPRRANPPRAKELTDIGDRSFRAGNTKRAEEKYNLAVKADPSAPMPHVHLAQVSMVRGDYVVAADHLRDAVTVAAGDGWLIHVPDIQAIFAEPGDFAKQLARLESHLQTSPNDRDAWFVLGAECFLSGRSKQASDVFQRLTDRKPDESLAAFLDASKTQMPAAPAPAANP